MSACAIRAIPTAICRCRRWRRATSRSPTSSPSISTATRSMRNGRSPYRERFIHGEIYKVRPDVNAVVHSHSPTVIPFSVTEKPLRAIFHNGHFLGQGAPVWEIREHAGEKNNMLVLTERARPLAGAGARPGLGGADARPRQRGRRPRPEDGGVPRDLYRGQCQAADAGGDARRADQFPQRIRGSSRRRTSTGPGPHGRNRWGWNMIHRMARIALDRGAARCSARSCRRAKAESVADFYRGKTVRLVIGYGAGGNYDLYGRLAAEFLGRHIPGNPTIIPVNMPGAGGFKAVDYLYRVAPQDGTHLGAVAQQLAMTLLVDDKMGIDPTTIQLSRPSHLDGRRRGGAAEERPQLVRGRAQARSHGRRRPVDLDVGHLCARPERLRRVPLQDRHRLQRHRRNSARRRARRSRRERRRIPARHHRPVS